MTITKLPPAYWQDYKKLRLEAIKNSPQSFISTIEETNKETQAEWKNKIKNMFFALDDENNLIGMIGCYKEKAEKLQHVANIVSFYIKPEFRRKGLGKEMIKTAIDFAKTKLEVQKIQLGVITTQTPAYELYKSVGFIKIGEQKMAIKVDEKFYDEYLMELYL
jgi:ribosomal protein S18 acetylase RimI-like enzyme